MNRTSKGQSLKSSASSLMVVLVSTLLVACSEIEGGDVVDDRNQDPPVGIDLPLDSQINLYCEDAGVFPDDCILDDPNNPYARANVSEANKFEVANGAPSAKARFYLWATVLAKSPNGENQFFTALSLHNVYAESASPVIREQTKKAYRSVLDNFFDSATFFVVELSEGDAAVAVAIKDLVGRNLYQPTDSSLVSLYTDPLFALDDMSSWGFIYDETNEIVTRFR